MGICINYEGKLKSPELIHPICEELEDIAKDMEWEYQLLDEGLDQPNTAHFSGAGVISGHVPLKGINLRIHQGAENLPFLFDKEGNLRCIVAMALINETEFQDPPISVKTQFAPIETHVTIVKLLRYLKDKYFSHLEVRDEGQYWETGDQELLKQNLDFLNERINEVGAMLDKLTRQHNESPESFADRFEAYLKERYKGGNGNMTDQVD